MQNHMRISTQIGRRGWILTALWCAALLLGAVAGWKSSDVWSPVLQEAARCSVHAGSCLLASLAGLLLTAAGCCAVGRTFVWVICPVQAFSLGALASAAGCCWRTGGALMAGMLLFSPMLISSVLLMLWQRMLQCSREDLLRAIPAGLCAALVISAVGSFVVSPFLMEVIYF